MSTLTEQFKRSLVIAKKNIKIYYLKGPVIIFGLVFPLFLALAYIIGRNVPLKEVLPGLIGMTTFFSQPRRLVLQLCLGKLGQKPLKGFCVVQLPSGQL